jgi:hypothetical protein
MDISLGPLSATELAMILGAVVAVAGLVVWLAHGPITIWAIGRIRIEVPHSPPAGQAIATLGVLVLSVGFLVQVLAGPAGRGMPSITANSGAPCPAPARAVPVSSRPLVTVTNPDCSTDLGQSVKVSGYVGRRRFSCYAVGWYVQNTDDWTAHYIRQLVHPSAAGTFTTRNPLEMGSPGETGSSWWPFLLGGSPAGCAWLHQFWQDRHTGEYRDENFPPPGSGLTLLYYAPRAIYRSH